MNSDVRHPRLEWRVRRDLRRWQDAALLRWKTSGNRGIVKVVTGGGKTVLAEACMAEFLNERPDGIVIVLVPTLSLLDQWWVSLQDDLEIAEADLAAYSGGRKPLKPGRVNLMVVNTGRTWGPYVASTADAMLVVDECHRVGSPANARALNAPYAATLGISATPERESDQGFEDVLVPALGATIYEYDYNQASRDGVIAPFELVNVQVNLSGSEVQEYEALTKRIAREMARPIAESHEEKVRQLLLLRAQVVAQARMRVPVAVRLVERFMGQRALVFHERIEAADEIYRLLLSRGHAATIYHSRMLPELRRDNLRQYRRGVFDVLVTCRALDEGMDVPETAVAVIASSTGSTRQRIQRLGRALRPAKGKSHATILTVFATEQERQRLAAEERTLSEARSVSWEKAQKAV